MPHCDALRLGLRVADAVTQEHAEEEMLAVWEELGVAVTLVVVERVSEGDGDSLLEGDSLPLTLNDAEPPDGVTLCEMVEEGVPLVLAHAVAQKEDEPL